MKKILVEFRLPIVLINLRPFLLFERYPEVYTSQGLEYIQYSLVH